jgi:hypothetical protein
MTDRLTLTRAFESAGMQSEAAERIATEIYDAIHDNVATARRDARDGTAHPRHADGRRRHPAVRRVALLAAPRLNGMSSRKGWLPARRCHCED